MYICILMNLPPVCCFKVSRARVQAIPHILTSYSFVQGAGKVSSSFARGSRGLGSASITGDPRMLPVTCDLVYTAHEKQLFRLIEANNGINMQIPLKGFQIDRALAQPHLS